MDIYEVDVSYILFLLLTGIGWLSESRACVVGLSFYEELHGCAWGERMASLPCLFLSLTIPTLFLTRVVLGIGLLFLSLSFSRGRNEDMIKQDKSMAMIAEVQN